MCFGSSPESLLNLRFFGSFQWSWPFSLDSPGWGKGGTLRGTPTPMRPMTDPHIPKNAQGLLQQLGGSNMAAVARVGQHLEQEQTDPLPAARTTLDRSLGPPQLPGALAEWGTAGGLEGAP